METAERGSLADLGGAVACARTKGRANALPFVASSGRLKSFLRMSPRGLVTGRPGRPHDVPCEQAAELDRPFRVRVMIVDEAVIGKTIAVIEVTDTMTLGETLHVRLEGRLDVVRVHGAMDAGDGRSNEDDLDPMGPAPLEQPIEALRGESGDLVIPQPFPDVTRSSPGPLAELLEATRATGAAVAAVEVRGRRRELRYGRPALWKQKGPPFEAFSRLEELLGKEISVWAASADDRIGRLIVVEEPSGMDIPLKAPKKPKNEKK